MSDYVYIKEIRFERNTQSGEMEIIVDSNHGSFRIGDDILDSNIINKVYDYIKDKADSFIKRWLADQMQQELESSSEDRAKKALEKLE